MLFEIFLSFVIIACLWLWLDGLKAREIALQAVIDYCHKMDLQLLDDCVALTKFWFNKSHSGKTLTWRTYVFEFSSTGFERYHGEIRLLGNRVERIVVESHRDPQQCKDH